MRPSSPDAVRRGDIEFEIVRCCARTVLAGWQRDRLKECLRRDIDWVRLLTLAKLHGLVPLIRFHLARTPELSKANREPLERTAAFIAQYNLLLTSRLLEISALLAQAGIVAVPFKGPALAAMAYQSLALRQFGDLDVFVHRHDIARAERLLIERGYAADERIPATSGARRAFLQSENHLVLQSPDEIQVELHWRVTPAWRHVRIDLDRLWRRIRLVNFAGREVPSLSVEDLFLVLCVHGAKHQWRRIGWICDLAELIRSHPSLCWEQVQTESRRAGLSRMVRLGVLLAVDVLDAAVPASVVTWAREDAALASLAGRIIQRHAVDTGDVIEGVDQDRFQLAIRDRWRDKLGYTIRRATTPRIVEWTLLPLPSGLVFLYSAIRPLRLLLAFASSVLRSPRAHPAPPA